MANKKVKVAECCIITCDDKFKEYKHWADLSNKARQKCLADT